ncbi:MAG: anti-sigma factor family protein [Rhizomicrobium sp.]
MNCPELLRTQAYLDGALDGAAATEAERHLRDCAECQKLAANLADLSDALHREATRHRAPDALRMRVSSALDAEARPKRTSRGFWFGAAGGSALTALAAALAFILILPPSAETLAQSVTDAHTDALMNGRMIEVASSNHHTVKPWFAGRVDVSPPVTDFAQQGFVLTGGRVDNVAGTRAAVVAYRHGKHEIDLFVWPDHGAKLPGESLRHGYRSFFLKNGDLDFAAVSDVERKELVRFTNLVRAEPE